MGDNNNQYQAVWTNSGGVTISNPATLTVVTGITGTISAVNSIICPGSPYQLQLSGATGQAPFTLAVNGKTYSGVTESTPFATIPTADQSIWNNSLAGINPSVDPADYELGVKFRTAINGYIKGIRFHKDALNTGIHVGSLWSITGTKLATATFTNESATGWQEVLFATPVAVTTGTIYVASYSDPSGYFSYNPPVNNPFQTAITNGDLSILSNTDSGSPGNSNIS